MLEDIMAFKQSGAAGIVFGCLLRDGQVDVDTAIRYVLQAVLFLLPFLSLN